MVLLTNFLPPYRVPLWEALAHRLSSLTVLVSTPVEADRDWSFEAGRLDVRVQRTLSFWRRSRHPAGFTYSSYLHIPWDTILQLRRLKPDVIIAGEFGMRTLFAALYVLAVSHCRLIVGATLTERTELGRGRVRLALRRWILARADRVIVNGASGARYVQGFGVPSNRIDRIAQVALPEFGDVPARTHPDHSVRRLLFVGRLIEGKGLIPFLRTLDDWALLHPENEITLSVAGSGPLEESVAGFRPRGRIVIRMEGHQDPRGLASLYARADALVFPTLADEWGLVVNEAFAAGVPVLGSIHSGAVEELCQDGITGWTFDPDDAQSMHSAIDRMLTASGDELAIMRARAKERVRGMTPTWAADRLAASVGAALRYPARRG